MSTCSRSGASASPGRPSSVRRSAREPQVSARSSRAFGSSAARARRVERASRSGASASPGRPSSVRRSAREPQAREVGPRPRVARGEGAQGREGLPQMGLGLPRAARPGEREGQVPPFGREGGQVPLRVERGEGAGDRDRLPVGGHRLGEAPHLAEDVRQALAGRQEPGQGPPPPAVREGAPGRDGLPVEPLGLPVEFEGLHQGRQVVEGRREVPRRRPRARERALGAERLPAEALGPGADEAPQVAAGREEVRVELQRVARGERAGRRERLAQGADGLPRPPAPPQQPRQLARQGRRGGQPPPRVALGERAGLAQAPSKGPLAQARARGQDVRPHAPPPPGAPGGGGHRPCSRGHFLGLAGTMCSPFLSDVWTIPIVVSPDLPVSGSMHRPIICPKSTRLRLPSLSST